MGAPGRRRDTRVAYELTDKELRVLGALIEKQVTTPDHYPLTLKGLTAACNQKSNRDPVMSLSESEVRETVALLEQQYLVSKRTEYGSRVTKHRQRFCNTEFGTLKLSPPELAVVCLLMLRGPQTPGELRSRSGRLYAFSSVDEVNETIEQLAARDDGPFVTRLAREAGRREARVAHLLGVDDPAEAVAAAPPERQPQSERAPAAPSRIERLEADVAALRETVAALREELDALKSER